MKIGGQTIKIGGQQLKFSVNQVGRLPGPLRSGRHGPLAEQEEAGGGHAGGGQAGGGYGAIIGPYRLLTSPPAV